MRPSAAVIFILGFCTVGLCMASLALMPPAEAAGRASSKAPTVERVAPMRVKVGGTIVIRGKNFSSRRVRNTVIFRGRRAVLVKPSAARANRLVVKVPGSVHLLLASRGGKAIPTRLRLQVLTRGRGERTARASRRTGLNQSPIVVPRPGPVITSGPSGSTSDQSARFTFASAKAASFECKLDGGDWQKCASPTSYSNLTLGTHRFSVRALDAAGEASAAPATRSWAIVQPASPDVQITFGPPATTSSPTADFAFSSTQAGSFECSLDLEPFSACTSPRSYTNVSPGAHEFRVRVTNANGSDVDTRQWTVTAAGSEPVNVAAQGTGDGLTFDGSTTGTPEPADFVTLQASLSHDPASGSGCVSASGTWRYLDSDGNVAAEFAEDGSASGLYCPASNSYSFYWRQVGGGPNDTGNFTLVYDSSAGTFTSQQNGHYTP